MSTADERAEAPVRRGPFSGWTGEALGFFCIRIWLGLRALLAGVEKFSGTKEVERTVINEFTELEETVTETVKVYGVEHYQAIPESLEAQFAAEPLLPGFLTSPFYAVLGYLLIVLGMTTLLGVCLRTTLMLTALVYTLLTVGLILINQSGGVAWLGIHVGLAAIALMLVKHQRLALVPKF